MSLISNTMFCIKQIIKYCLYLSKVFLYTLRKMVLAVLQKTVCVLQVRVQLTLFLEVIRY